MDHYAACAWSLVFGAVHAYWAIGGTRGLVAFSLPSNEELVLVHDPTYIAIVWGVVVLSLVGAAATLAATHAWGRVIPRSLLLSTLWAACAATLVRGIGNPIQTLLIRHGIIEFAPLSSPLAREWTQWLHLDLVLFSPWFFLGGVLFGATAWLARRRAG